MDTADCAAPTPESGPQNPPAPAYLWLALIALAGVALHLACINQYNYFRDEFYYMACGRHPAWGYVDFPPFIGALGAVVMGLFGESLLAVRIWPVLAGAVMTVATGLIAREAGGGRFAQCLAALAFVAGPVFLGNCHLYGVNPFDEMWWVLGAYILVRLLARDQARLWMAFGVVAGAGLMTKSTMLFFGLSVFVGLVLSPSRKAMATRWPWLGGLIAFAIFLPHLVWQARHGWPVLELTGGYVESKTYQGSPLEFAYMHLLTIHPLTAPIWIAGLVFCFRPAGRRFRLIGWMFVFLFVAFTVLKAKFYWLSPAFPMLLGLGAPTIERFAQARRRWIRWAYPAAVAVGGALTAPLAIPILPVETEVWYLGLFGTDAGVKSERQEIAELPQHFADMFGWEELVAAAARAYQGLPEAERKQCAVLGEDYGIAGAIDLFGARYGLPRAISGHNTYYLWGPGSWSGDVVITVGLDPKKLEPLFDSVELKERVARRYCMPHENNSPVCVCRGLRFDVATAWPQAKTYH